MKLTELQRCGARKWRVDLDWMGACYNLLRKTAHE